MFNFVSVGLGCFFRPPHLGEPIEDVRDSSRSHLTAQRRTISANVPENSPNYTEIVHNGLHDLDINILFTSAPSHATLRPAVETRGAVVQ